MIKVVFLILLSLSTIQIYASEHIGPYDENLISSFTQLNWDGPEVKITNGLLNVAGKELTPLYLSVNPQAVGRFPGKEEEAWQRIFNQVDLALQNGVDDYSYCFLESGEHMRRCGYQASQYGPAPIFDVHKSKMEFKNSCNCP